MSSYPTWTPASRPGIIPLYPLGFGTILGRSFAALRANPRVLLGFALIAQSVAYLVLTAVLAAVAWATFSRLDTVVPGSDDFNAIMAGSVTITAISAIVLGLGVGALTIIVQAVVIAEVSHSAVAEKLTLRALWQQVKPVVWRLFGYSVLVITAVLVAMAIIVGGLVALGFAIAPLAVVLGIMLVLGAIPVSWWLMIKLLLVPAAIVIERQSITDAVRRSWVLTRGRFWRTLGLILVISLIFGAVSQVISLPLGLLSSGITTVIAPTGDPEPSAIVAIIVVALLAQALTLVLQSVALVVQSTATAIIYIDARMRREGLDLDLMAHVERRDAGARDLDDPYLVHIGREIAPRDVAGAPTYPQYAAYPQYGAPPQYSPPQPYGAPPQYSPPQQYAPAPAYTPPAQQYAPPPPYTPPAATPPKTAPEESGPSATQWAAPGASPSPEQPNGQNTP